ncbi:MAG: C4-dicarboxylic acid transporter DauA [Elusimicrobia bacterium]|jgi:SulP family sulfate permease|nr:C4-dicarboxylic acid transporter DauA [Elusimicrobiota bacterium]MBK7545045.1 C4-dicarboxylic acid transporter DauA [Elusimicrobiota bacterium]MBK7574564.1 C4-dicarboxylic acid transporter DauA [Elusimicrobiota bacterium]MBK7688068.1 C4-dicarboxylic acid transporter DauA [Elusimicrobiota bacterium]MBK8126711.1 C4-dicarboxylic acid transporter DauA [Elusimicrobiota bacterium]
MKRLVDPARKLIRVLRLRPFQALRERWAEGYTRRDLTGDLLAGLTVGLVAVPLSMALAVASGVAPQHGLYTAIVAGFLTPLFGGSRYQVTGPTAAFVVILAPIASRHGLAGLALAGAMAGVLLILMGLARMGQVIQFVPHPVTTGFTSGIALVIATLQIKDFFGLQPGALPDHFVPRLGALWAARATVSGTECAIGAVTLFLFWVWPKFVRRVPALLGALAIVTFGVAALESLFPSFRAATVATRFAATGGIPAGAPPFVWPWAWAGPSGAAPVLSFAYIESLLPAALAIALLGAIESLLSAVVADGMTRTRHDPDAELLALGQGNIAAAFFGGLPATGAFARTAAGIRAGARSPLAAMTHALTVLGVVLLFAPWISRLPMAAMAALLLVVAYHMSEIRRVRHLGRVAPRGDLLVLAACFLLTVLFDMVIGVSAGIVLAALLFLRRMARHTRGRSLSHGPSATGHAWPRDVFVYEIAGPLFFGAVENALGALRAIHQQMRCVVLILTEVPHLDATALVALEAVLSDLRQGGRSVVLVGAGPQPLRLLKRAGLLEGDSAVQSVGTIDEALSRVGRRDPPRLIK